MDIANRIETALEGVVQRAQRDSTGDGRAAPPKLASALRHAVFPGGARVRPQLCLAVAKACGDDAPGLSDAAAAAIELLHCASLVHDDLPMFDNADLRRGLPSAHAAFGEPVALLTGDALIVAAFEALARAGASRPERALSLTKIVARSVGAPHGIVAGQAWESEPAADLAAYQRAKTGILFEGATVAGAVSAGGDPGPWRALGARLGDAYQVADDIRDVVCDETDLGKPQGQDAALDRPSVVASLGMMGAVKMLRAQVQEAVDSIPPCDGAERLRDLVRMQAERLTPKSLAASAA
ncbi:MAG: polyprenyl synthetase family protein [Pseudomonadota bacterium]